MSATIVALTSSIAPTAVCLVCGCIIHATPADALACLRKIK